MGKVVAVVASAAEAVAGLGGGASVAVGGFGLCGVPYTLIDAVYDAGATALSIVSNNCGTIGLASAGCSTPAGKETP